jgi:hypothetical protein
MLSPQRVDLHFPFCRAKRMAQVQMLNRVYQERAALIDRIQFSILARTIR